MSTQEELLDLTQRVLNDEPVTAEEYKKVIDTLRGGRRSGASGTKKQTHNLPPDLNDLFKE